MATRRRLFIKLHQIAIKHCPDFERFELARQLGRAAYSVPANIVEGFARRHRRARLHFLNISESSFAETWYCLHAARRLGSLTKTVFEDLECDLNGVGAPLTGLIRSIEESSSEIDRPGDKRGRRRSSFPPEK